MAASYSPATVQQSQSGCLFFDIAPPRAFSFDQKLIQNVAQIILHMTKQFLSCLNWLIKCFRFQNMFWKNISCFRFWWKNLHKALHKQLCNTTCQKTFFACTLRLVKYFQFQDVIWKTEECCVSKNIELKIWREKFRFWFCFAFVYFANFLQLLFYSYSNTFLNFMLESASHTVSCICTIFLLLFFHLEDGYYFCLFQKDFK